MIAPVHDWSMVHNLTNRPMAAPAITILAYVLAQRLQRRWPRNPLLNPTLFAIVLVVGYIEACDVSYANYLANTQIINFMLGPAVVLLAVPLYHRLGSIRASWRLISVGLLAGMPAGVISSVAIGMLCHAKMQTLYSLVPRSVTTGIALGLSEALGGVPALTAVLVISTGIFGAVFGPWLLRVIGVRDERVIGLAIGMGSHGIGTARAFQLSETAGAFASLAMSLNGVATAVMVPLAASLIDLHVIDLHVIDLHVAAPTLAGGTSSPPITISPIASLPIAARIGRVGADFWSVLHEHQAQLLTTFTGILALAILVTLLFTLGHVRHRCDPRRPSRNGHVGERCHSPVR